MIILFQVGALCDLPPVISLIRTLRDLGEEVAYVTLSHRKPDKPVLDSLGIPYRRHRWEVISKREPIVRVLKEIEKPFEAQVKRRWVWRQIRDLAHGNLDNVIIWSVEMQGAAMLGERALKFGRRHICTLYELGDESTGLVKRFDKDVFYQSTTLVECEQNRARVLQEEKHLERLPFVIPNKPYGHPRTRRMRISDPNAEAVVKTWGDRPVFLYQGAVCSDRHDVIQMLEWLCEGLPDAVIAVMAKPNEITDELKGRYANFSLVPYVPPPRHLEITSWATVGVAAYNSSTCGGRYHPLNAVYCAPNKIYEYTGFGVPVLGNGIAGLKSTIGDHGAGICVEKWERASVIEAARTIQAEYQRYSEGATRFFDQVNVSEIVSTILNFARG